MEKAPPHWEQALYVLSRLPLELRHDIYKYTLVAERPVDLRDEAKSERLYRWQEPTEVATQGLKRASDFYIWAAPAIKHDEVHDYFLSHNTFFIQNKVGADTLVTTIQNLSKAGFSTTVHGLEILVQGKQLTREDGNEGLDMLPNSKDYAKCDRDHVALGAYRILKPLTKLHRFRSLHITLREGRHRWPFFNIPFHNSYEVVPRVIFQLKDLVIKNSKDPKFNISHQIAYGTHYAEENDISEMWNPKSNKQRKKLPEKFSELGKEAMDLYDLLDEEQYEMDGDAIYNDFFRDSDDDFPIDYEPTYEDLARWGY